MPTADELLGAAVAGRLVDCLKSADPKQSFATTAGAAAELGDQSLSERAFALRDALLQDLGGDFARVEQTVLALLKDDAFDGWMTWPIGEAVATSALNSTHPDAFERGLDLLRELTPLLSSEFAIRPFLQHDLAAALAQLQGWTVHPDAKVRRLVSEGTRPRLPWAKRVREIYARPEVTVPLLAALYRDESEDVRRSVANHVNDISRLDPPLAVATCAAWRAQPDANTPRLVRHALRTLVKEADASALALLGFGTADQLDVSGPHLVAPADEGSPQSRAVTVEPGGDLLFTATVTNRSAEPVKVALDYVVHFLKASGETAPKVFKITTRTLAPQEQLTIERRRSFKPLTTRRYYPGTHGIELQVNGARSGRIDFLLDAIQ